MLNNPFYCGIIRIKRTGRIYQGCHEPLISAALFEKVQQIKSGKSGPKVTRHDHTYRGLFRCGVCTGPMVPELQKGHVYYRCQSSGCETKTIREDRLADAIEARLSQLQLTDTDLKASIAVVDTWATESHSDDHEKNWQLRLASLRDRSERLTDALIDRLIDQDAYTERRQKLALEEAHLHEEKAERANISQKADRMRAVLELANNLSLSHRLAETAEKREVIEMASSNRLVTGKKITIEPSNWLVEAKNVASVFNGALTRDTDRTSPAVLSGVDKLFDLLEPPKRPKQKATKHYFETTE